MNNEITAYFKGTTGVAESVYQHDYGMIMNIDGLTLSETFDVHFEISGSASTITAIGSNNRVAIPNDCLAVPGKLTAYIYTHTGSHDGETAYVVTFQVINRARPDDDITDASEENNAKAIVRLQTEHEADVFKINDNLDAIENAATALTTRVTTAEGDIDVLEGRIDTAISAVTTDTEVTDIRVGADGTTYSTAGEAVRNQFSNLKSALSESTVNLLPNYSFKSTTKNTVSLVVDEENIININGTASATGVVNVVPDFTLGAGHYYIENLTLYTNLKVQVREIVGGADQGNIVEMTGWGEFTLAAETTVRVRLHLNNGTQYINAKASLMLTKDARSDYYIPNRTALDYTSRYNDSLAFKTQAKALYSGLNDLNNATDKGYYNLASSVDYDNLPSEVRPHTTGALSLFVYSEANGYVLQILVMLSSIYQGNVYIRTRSGGSSPTWGNWTKISTMQDYQIRNATELTDFNDATKAGNYTLSASASYANSPLDAPAPSNLIVHPNITGSYFIQDFYVNSGNVARYKHYRRLYADHEWKPWVLVYDYQAVNAFLQEPTKSLSFTRQSVASQGANEGHSLRVMSYNICQFNNDTATYISDEKLFNLKKMLYKADADILAIQEDAEYIDGSSQSSDNYFYYPKYPYRNGIGSATIHSKTHHTSGDVLNYSNGRALRFSVYDISAGIKLLMISTHPVANYNSTGPTSDESIAARNTQYDELFKWIKGEITLNKSGTTTPVSVPTFTHCIIGMDANSITDTDKTNLTNKATSAGYIMGNGGALGWLVTSLRGGDASIDNIIVSPNVIINNIESYSDWYDKLYSDHVPVVADVTLL